MKQRGAINYVRNNACNRISNDYIGNIVMAYRENPTLFNNVYLAAYRSNYGRVVGGHVGRIAEGRINGNEINVEAAGEAIGPNFLAVGRRNLFAYTDWEGIPNGAWLIDIKILQRGPNTGRGRLNGYVRVHDPVVIENFNDEMITYAIRANGIRIDRYNKPFTFNEADLNVILREANDLIGENNDDARLIPLSECIEHIDNIGV